MALRAVRAAALVFVALAASCHGPRSFKEPSPPTPRRGMVVSEHPLATQVGLDVLDAGGNALDAAVATALALAVVHPQAGNLGGGGFALYVPHRGAARALDFRETAPAALTPEHFLDEHGAPVVERLREGALAAGVPGSPAGLFALHAFGGRLPFERLVRPAIELAREGFEVDEWLAANLAEPATRARLTRFAGTQALFYPGGEPLSAGEELVQPDLARTLERYARLGPAGFYGVAGEPGPVANALLATMWRHGGVLVHGDLLAYRPIEREPLVRSFRGYEIVAMPPPSSGGVLILQALRILDGFPLDQERARTLASPGEPGAVDRSGIGARALHWWIEALRCAFADRAEHLGDPDHFDVPTAELLSQAWINRRRVSIGEVAHPDVGPWAPSAEEAAALDEDGNTTHLSVLDRDGHAVSLTTTLNSRFGSGLYVDGAGFLLNDEIDDFALQPGLPNQYGLRGSRANALAAGKRPLSSMSPTVVRGPGQTVYLVIGSPGGPKIITAVLEVLLRVLVYGQELEEAVRAPRLHQQWKLGDGVPERTLFEPGWAPELLAALQLRNHEVEVVTAPMGSVQAILVELGGEPVGASDPRRGGVAGAQGLPLPAPASPGEWLGVPAGVGP